MAGRLNLMELNNELHLPVPVEQAWAMLTDLERIAPFVPGVRLQEVEGEEFRGTVKVKVGPLTAQYKGKVSFIGLDPGTHRAVLKAEGRETRGQGNAAATVTAELSAHGTGTSVRLATEMTVTGKVAELGEGPLAHAGTELIEQFATRLEARVLRPAVSPPADEPGQRAEPMTASDSPAAPEPAVATRSAAAPGPGAASPEVPGGSVARRLAPVGAGLLTLVFLWRTVRRRR